MLRLLIRILARLLYRLEVRGEFHRGPGTLYVGNHQSFLDAPILFTLLPPDTIWVVHSQVMRSWVFRKLMGVTEHIVIDTTNPFAMKSTIAAIEAGRSVIIFPEGRLTTTGALMKVYDGPAFIAAKSGARVAPFIIDGSVRAKVFSRMKGDFALAWFPKITLTCFPPTAIPMPEAESGKLRRRKAGEEMRRILQRTWFLSRPKRSLHEAFLDAVELHGRSRPMVEDAQGRELTFGGLLKGSLALGRVVSRIAAENEAVGLLLPNAAATMALILGLFGVRRLPAMLNYTSGVDGMQSALRAAAVKTIITSRAFLERARLGPVVERLEGVRILYLEELRDRITLGDKLWLVFYALRAPRAATLRSAPDDPALVIYTSGSEGKPKGVVLSHWNFLSDIEQALGTVDLTRADRIFAAMPVFHSFGMIAGILLPAVSGMPVFLYPSPLHYSIVPEMFYDRDATILFATPTFLKHYARRAHPYDFRRVRYLVAGAEKLSEEVRRTYSDKFGVRVIEGYGATECSPIISLTTYMRHKTGTVGELLPGMECRIEPVPGVEEGGLLHVRGPNVMLGYWRDSAPRVLEPPSSVYGPGWYATGDLARIDEDGFLQILGRVKRFAKVAGEMVSLEVAENIAETASPRLMHGAVIRPDPGRGEMIVLATTDRALRRDQLIEAARALGAPDIAVPRRIVHIDKMPLLGTGKKNYVILAQQVEELLAQPTA
jgi:acyl-[acyl-carrier-protein]-phospholipid O-acyltransferase/long-chain-fatty-acid--[acyl-carrier-protein] ligase